MEIPGTKRFIPKGFELGPTLSKPNGSIGKFLFTIMISIPQRTQALFTVKHANIENQLK